jgi:hypothetical protein
MSNEAVAAPVDGEQEAGAPAAAAFEADGLRGWAEALVDRARSEGVAWRSRASRPAPRARGGTCRGHSPGRRAAARRVFADAPACR